MLFPIFFFCSFVYLSWKYFRYIYEVPVFKTVQSSGLHSCEFNYKMIDDVSRVKLLSSIIPVIIDIHIIPYNLGYKLCNNDMVVMGYEGEGAIWGMRAKLHFLMIAYADYATLWFFTTASACFQERHNLRHAEAT